MTNLEEIQNLLEGLKKSRKKGLPIAGWRSSALTLFGTLCSEDSKKRASTYEVAKSLSKKLAIECMAELDRYFHNFKFMGDEERYKWQELSNHLRRIYS
jgi:hypothetical protein|tara:strand:+ start:118 stop:414 length:297 start_codon:yes stop_codon:yes gene_type:complete